MLPARTARFPTRKETRGDREGQKSVTGSTCRNEPLQYGTLRYDSFPPITLLFPPLSSGAAAGEANAPNWPLAAAVPLGLSAPICGTAAPGRAVRSGSNTAARCSGDRASEGRAKIDH